MTFCLRDQSWLVSVGYPPSVGGKFHRGSQAFQILGNGEKVREFLQFFLEFSPNNFLGKKPGLVEKATMWDSTARWAIKKGKCELYLPDIVKFWEKVWPFELSARPNISSVFLL